MRKREENRESLNSFMKAEKFPKKSVIADNYIVALVLEF